MQHQSTRFTPRFALMGAIAAAALLSACGSSVKLDENAGKPAPISDASTKSSQADANANASSNVNQVVLTPKNDDALAGGLTRVIYFDFDSFVVKEEFSGAIDGHAKRLTANKGKKVIVEGHTDERGGREYNLALGQKRAEAVQKSLTLLGVSAEQVEAVSFGEERPAVTGASEEAWAKNRRAEIKDR
ncbi:MAG: peptidoglycan-associated lipoprotein Pal [Pseudomonadota bacterium]|uniref:peptidoglycan-associated lipoprotein Pal n=1 Tax=Aquabacterium sp. TaxID=1872578 RepID=UPI001D22C48A|nr:peptidoglycan-associated lipoprotein Pal [Aquabacterium sp.]MBT9610600.1 peptidoglycan-associated lipoprotein Pal [Aquabacterium sp.]|tara:strand:+ start:651 stop:1214 length:564 start_codon:yes stop_codon:yes gene_type:complete